MPQLIYGSPSCDDLRSDGWVVAVHNDYRQTGALYTFWLFTKDGFEIHAEGGSDVEALDAVRHQADSHVSNLPYGSSIAPA